MLALPDDPNEHLSVAKTYPGFKDLAQKKNINISIVFILIAC